MRKKYPDWIKPAMGWLDSKGYLRHSESDYRSFFDHVIVCDDMILSFPYGLDKERIIGFKSFCKMHGYIVHFYEAPSTYFEGTNTVAIYPRDYDLTSDKITPWVSIMRLHIEKALDKQYPSRKHKFIIGEELFKDEYVRAM